MIKLIDKIHIKLLLDIIYSKLKKHDNWIINEYRYYNQYLYDDDSCSISITYSKVYNKIEFFNKMKNKYGIYTISYFNRFELKRKLSQLISIKKYSNINDILDLTENNIKENQEAENGEKE